MAAEGSIVCGKKKITIAIHRFDHLNIIKIKIACVPFINHGSLKL